MDPVLAAFSRFDAVKSVAESNYGLTVGFAWPEPPYSNAVWVPIQDSLPLSECLKLCYTELTALIPSLPSKYKSLGEIYLMTMIVRGLTQAAVSFIPHEWQVPPSTILFIFDGVSRRPLAQVS